MVKTEELRLYLLGGLQIMDGRLQDLTTILSSAKKAQALLCYLALNNHTHYRRDLAGKFWGDKSERLAQGSLRVAISALREAGLEPYLHITHNTLAFNQYSAYWCDAETFTQLLHQFRHGAQTGDISLLQQAVDLYRGDFLDGFMLGDTPDFDEWVVVQREHWRQLVLTALDTLVNTLLATKQYANGITYASRQLTIDPLREPTYRQLMWLLAGSGQRQAALEQYERCREWLLLQLGVEPEEETTAVHEAIKFAPRTGTRPLHLPTVLATEQDAPPFQAPPLVSQFVGRRHPLAYLEAALTVRSESAEWVGSLLPPRWGIVGMGGVGKTTLAVQLAHRLRPYFPDGV
ncbi:MAG TPA: BTAD domain-containing putative transcriptional regulator, partial [Chloroflexota bacterium]|nr:BTAD domain-containing putative transcriptional regulator [Chloroflexota bacterium]